MTRRFGSKSRTRSFDRNYSLLGMADYLETFSNRLSEHNKRGLVFMRDELASFYGNKNFVDSLHEIGHKSVKRSNIPHQKKAKHANMLGLVSEVC